MSVSSDNPFPVRYFKQISQIDLSVNAIFLNENLPVIAKCDILVRIAFRVDQRVGQLWADVRVLGGDLENGVVASIQHVQIDVEILKDRLVVVDVVYVNVDDSVVF